MSAQKTKPIGVFGAILGLVGFSVIAGVLVTAMVTPALAVTSITAKSGIGVFQNLPEFIKIDTQSQRNQIYALSGGQPVLIGTTYKQNRQEVADADISPFLKNAAVAGEDRRFFEHGGVDVPSVARAAIGNANAGSTQSGSSTLDMQLVRNIRVQEAFAITDKAKRDAGIRAANERTLPRKLSEMKLAIGLDKRYTKQQILVAYLNIVGMGGNTYGVESAAQTYFSVSAKDVTLPQAASLIAIVQNPSIQSLRDPRYYKANKVRRDQILDAMLQEKYITEAQHTAAIAATIESEMKPSPVTNGCLNGPIPSARVVCDYVTKLITVDAGNFPNLPPAVTALGATPAERLANWDRGGYKVYTSLNVDLQNAAQTSMATQVPATETRLPLGGAADTVEVGTGRILVMAQSKIFDDGTPAAPNTTALNYSTDRPWGQSSGFAVGSTYKVYDLANWLSIGKGLGDIVDGSSPQTYKFSSFKAPCNPGVLASNTFNLRNDTSGGGQMSVKTALVGSINNAFMQMAEQQDLCAIRDTAISMGAHKATGKPLEVNPNSVIGTNEMAPLTVAAEGATVASGGLYCVPRIIDQVTGPDGKNLGGQAQTCSQSEMTPEVAAGVANAMQASFTSGTSRPGTPGDGVPIAGKTGTTNSAESVWILGTTTKISTAVWTGNIVGKASLRKLVNPITRQLYASSSRFNVFKAVMRPADQIPELKGGAFPTASSKVLNGNSVIVPDLTGLSTTTAQSLLQSLKFTYALGGTTASALPAGRIVSSNPPAGSRSSAGTTVTVTTSDGSLATTMINVVSETQQKAKSDIASAGITGTPTYSYVAGTPDNLCKVASTSPGAGVSMSKSDIVNLTVYGRPTSDPVNGFDPGAACPK